MLHRRFLISVCTPPIRKRTNDVKKEGYEVVIPKHRIKLSCCSAKDCSKPVNTSVVVLVYAHVFWVFLSNSCSLYPTFFLLVPYLLDMLTSVSLLVILGLFIKVQLYICSVSLFHWIFFSSVGYITHL